MNGLRAFLRGVARAFNPFGVLGPRLEDVRRPGEAGARADARALASDWRAVGDDMKGAMWEEVAPGLYVSTRDLPPAERERARRAFMAEVERRDSTLARMLRALEEE